MYKQYQTSFIRGIIVSILFLIAATIISVTLLNDIISSYSSTLNTQNLFDLIGTLLIFIIFSAIPIIALYLFVNQFKLRRISTRLFKEYEGELEFEFESAVHTTPRLVVTKNFILVTEVFNTVLLKKSNIQRIIYKSRARRSHTDSYVFYIDNQKIRISFTTIDNKVDDFLNEICPVENSRYRSYY